MNVEKYKQKMELYMMRVGIREHEDTTISRFLSGFNLDIRESGIVTLLRLKWLGSNLHRGRATKFEKMFER